MPNFPRQRFVMELEFVQCLANPIYLQHLASSRLLSGARLPSIPIACLTARDPPKDEAFIKYLAYLQYWKKPEYAKFVAYPYCFFFLEQLQHAEFREKLLLDPGFAAMVLKQTEAHWRFYRLHRNTVDATLSQVKAE
jgi:mediator of RNA polymerase II transcription subunit 31